MVRVTDSPERLLPTWFSNNNSVVLQLYCLVHVGIRRETGELDMGFLLPQPRNDQLSFIAHWTGSVSRPLPFGRGMRSAVSCMPRGEDNLVSQDSSSIYHNEFPTGQVVIIECSYTWAILDTIMEWERYIQQNLVEYNAWRKIITFHIYFLASRDNSLNCTHKSIECFKSTGWESNKLGSNSGSVIPNF